MLSMHLRQLFRKPTRTALYLAVLILLTAFFCTSLNLYKDSQYNLQLADNAYTTIAVIELCADVNRHGKIITDITDKDYAGNQPVTVYGYDLDPIIKAPSVKKYELRARYGAFSDDNIALVKSGKLPLFSYDIIRFTIKSKGNIPRKADGTYDYSDEYYLKNNLFYVPTRHELYRIYVRKSFALDVTYSALGILHYNYGANESSRIDLDMPQIENERQLSYYSAELNNINYGEATDYDLFIEPDTEYIASVLIDYIPDVLPTIKDNLYRVVGITFWRDMLFCEHRYYYYKNKAIGPESASMYVTLKEPFWIQKVENISQEDLEKFEQISRAYYIGSRSFAVMTTNDISGIPAFNLGNMFIRDGRSITANEYESGKKVCMISRELAKAQKWKVGEKIKFSFYEYNCFTNSTADTDRLIPFYTYTSPDNFFDSGEYEVVGIYDVRPMTGSSTISEAAISVPWNTIYIPEKSLENAPAEEDRPVTGALLTIWLENGKIEPFIERMNELGITGAKQGDYEARFTFYDQGYSRIQPSLEALSGTAELLLILSSSLLAIAALLLAFFYAQSQKQSIGTMRLLGCSKARAFAAVMLSALIIAVTGALIGAAIGHALTASVGESIMASANQTPEEFLAFSAYLAESTQVDVEFALGADAKVSLLTCLAALGLFIAGTLVFVLRYLGKGPRELLPRAGE